MQVLTGLRARRARTDQHRFDSAVTAFSGVAVYGLSLLTGPLLARALDPAGRGALAAVLVPTTLFGWLIGFGVPVAAAYYARSYTREQLVTASWVVSLVLGVPITAALWVYVPRYLSDYDPVTIGWFRGFLLLGLLAVPMGACIELVRAEGAGIRFNVLRSLNLLINAVLVIALALVGRLTLTSALLVMALATVVQTGVVLGSTRGWPTRDISWPVLRTLFHYGLRVALGTLAALVMARLDQLLMVRLVSPADLGIYVVAATAAGVTIPVSQGISTALFPHLRTADAVLSEQRFAEAMRWVLLSTVGISALIALAAPWGLPLLFGEPFRDAVTPLMILLPGQVAWGLAMVIGAKLQAQGRPGAASQAMALGALITIVGIGPAVSRFGVEGAAGLTTFSQVALLGWARFADRRGAVDDDALKSDAEATDDADMGEW